MPAAAAGAPARADSVYAALAGGNDLITALEQTFGNPIDAFGTTDRVEALFVLSGVDSCADVPLSVKDDVPDIVRILITTNDVVLSPDFGQGLPLPPSQDPVAPQDPPVPP